VVKESVVDLDEYRESSRLPIRPLGYQVLVAIPESREKTDGGVYMPDTVRDREQAASETALVLDFGPDAYQDKIKFPSGAYVKKGDWIVIKRYSGERHTYQKDGHLQAFSLIHDDAIRASTTEPKGWVRV